MGTEVVIASRGHCTAIQAVPDPISVAVELHLTCIVMYGVF